MKFNKKKNIRYLSLLCMIILFLISVTVNCGGDDDKDTVAETTGTLYIGLTDASTGSYDAVYVTIEEISIHRGDTDEDVWDIVSTPNKTYNLLELVNGVIENLGAVKLVAGHYTQIILLLGEEPDMENNILGEGHQFPNYVVNHGATITDDDSVKYQELKVPSGYQSGIMLDSAFDIQAGTTTELILDFDATKSIVIAGKSGKLILKPTIKVISLIGSSATGRVVDSEGVGVPDVYVSAQTYDSTADDEKDRVTVSNGTITDSAGYFFMFLEVGIYYLGAYRDYMLDAENFFPACQRVNAELTGAPVEEEIILSSAGTEMFTVSGAVSIDDVADSEEQIVTISFRQTTDCSPADTELEEIEIKSLKVADGGTYSITLPLGTYTAVASTEDHRTQFFTIDANTSHDFVF